MNRCAYAERIEVLRTGSEPNRRIVLLMCSPFDCAQGERIFISLYLADANPLILSLSKYEFKM